VIEQDRKGFFDGMAFLRNCYPSFRPTSEDFAKTISTYFDALRSLTFEAVRGGMLRAPKPNYYPDYFPSAGQLHRVCVEVSGELAKLEERRQRSESEHRQNETDLDRWKRLPTTQHGQGAYIAEGVGPFGKLARLWECESKAMGIKPWEITPKEMHAQRMVEFWKTWARVVEAKPVRAEAARSEAQQLEAAS
jgi:hypothetical protein